MYFILFKEMFMKNILIILIMLLSFNLFATKLLTNKKNEKKMFEALKKAELIVEGEVIGIETVIFNFNSDNDTAELITSQEDINNSTGKIEVKTKLSIKITETFKGKSDKVIDVWIEGGEYEKNGNKLYQFSSSDACTLMEIGDVMIMGLNKNDSNVYSVEREDYTNGYFFYEGDLLQIPSSKKMIDEVEMGLLQDSKHKSEKSMAEDLVVQESMELKYLDALVKKEENATQSFNKVNNLKNKLRRRIYE